MLLQAYIKSAGVYQCPSEKTAGSSDPYNAAYTDYLYNSLLGSPITQVNKFTEPSLTIMFVEGPTGNARQNTNGTGAPTTCQMGNMPGAAMRHLGGAVYALADGHAKWVPAQTDTTSNQVWNKYCHPGLSPSNENFVFGYN
jgi:prepilin-type processing-associated H-X9-DG protein